MDDSHDQLCTAVNVSTDLPSFGIPGSISSANY